MSNFCIMRIQKIKTFSQMSAAFKHNYRIRIPDNADPDRTQFNQELVPMPYDSYNETYKSFTANLGYGIDKPYRKNGVLAFEIMLTFSREALPNINIDKWKEDSLNWIRENFNACPQKYGDNVLSAVYHADESTPHMHILVAPVDEKGHLSAYHYIHGPKSLRQLQTSYAEAMRPHNLLRGLEFSSARHQDIQKMYSELNKALAITAPELTREDSLESYQTKVIEDLKDRSAVFLYRQKSQEAELQRISDIHRNEKNKLNTHIKKAVAIIKNDIREKEEFEREFGPIETVKKQLTNVQLLKEALSDIEPDKAEEFIEQLNEFVRIQRVKEKEKNAKEKAQAKKAVETYADQVR